MNTGGRRGVAVALIAVLATIGCSDDGGSADDAAPTTTTAATTTTTEAEPGTPKLLVVGIDGLVWDRVADADAPVFDRLAEEGALGESLLPYEPPEARTESAPGWTTLLTGTWPDQHGVVDNSFAGATIGDHPDLFTRAERSDPALDTWVGVDWFPLSLVVIDQVDEELALSEDYVANDVVIADEGAAHLRDDPADASFAYFGQVDEAGHSFGAASDEYLAAIEAVDAHIGTLLDAVAARATRDDESWLVLVGTDHGHTDAGGHGEDSPEEKGTFVLGWGDGVEPGPVEGSELVDLAASALAHLGVPLDDDLAGEPRFAPS